MVFNSLSHPFDFARTLIIHVRPETMGVYALGNIEVTPHIFFLYQNLKKMVIRIRINRCVSNLLDIVFAKKGRSFQFSSKKLMIKNYIVSSHNVKLNVSGKINKRENINSLQNQKNYFK